ncbi:MAG: hypothetical protein V7767_02220, partial [Leeuwenhoekiella sp.]
MQRISTPILYGIFCLFCLSTSLFTDLKAQCAGDDASLTVCDKKSNQFIDLFAQLGSAAQAGGTWTDDDNTGGLNSTTGILNTYLINIGGTFRYTYTVNNISGCTDNSSTITLTLGSYPGISNANAVSCSDDNRVNLFQFTGSSPSPTLDGIWTSADAPLGSLSGSIFNARSAGMGKYTFTYTVPARGTCPALTSMVQIEVIKAPESGSVNQADEPIFCETDDLSAFTSYDLRTVLTNEDEGGSWTESGTNEISNTTDSVINIENLRDTFGSGTYTFNYTVNPINPACAPSTTTVSVLIEDVVDFTGAVFDIITPDNEPEFICSDELPYQAVAQISVDPSNVPDGNYEITYTTTPTPNAGTETLSVAFLNGIGKFNINPALLVDSGDVTIEVTQVVDPNTRLQCQVQISGLQDVLSIIALPDLSDSVITIDEPICMGNDISLTINDSGNTPQIELVDGEYQFTYTIYGQGNSVSKTQTVIASGGTVQFTLNTSSYVISGDYDVEIDLVVNSNGCEIDPDTNASFRLDPRPEGQSLTVSIADTCADADVIVNIVDTGDPIFILDGEYKITYSISGAITANDLITENISIVDGVGKFNLPGDIIMPGVSNIQLTELSNGVTGCESQNFSLPTADFNIIANPDLANTNLSVASICENDIAILT